MVALPIACATVGAVLPFTPAATALGFTTLPLTFFLILLAMIVGYLALVEVVKARFYAAQDRPRGRRPSQPALHHRHVHRRAARFKRTVVSGRHRRPVTVS
jgi:Mg2+-importing ATPase